MKRRAFLKYSLLMLIIAIGVGIFTYPTIASVWNEYVSSQVSIHHTEDVAKKSRVIDYSKEWEMAAAYNKTLVKETSFISEETYETKDEVYESLLNINGDGVMGVIEIPCISQRLPIYHYTTDNELNKGVGHIYGSSLPTGEIGNTILTGHSAVASNPLFTRLDEVNIDDEIYLHIMDKDFAYRVTDIYVVKPEDVESLVIDKEKSLITLITCTPFAINSHRLIVVAEQTDYPESPTSVTTLQSVINTTDIWKLFVGAFIFVFFLIVCTVKYEREVKTYRRNSVNAIRDCNSDISSDPK